MTDGLPHRCTCEVLCLHHYRGSTKTDFPKAKETYSLALKANVFENSNFHKNFPFLSAKIHVITNFRQFRPISYCFGQLFSLQNCKIFEILVDFKNIHIFYILHFMVDGIPDFVRFWDKHFSHKNDQIRRFLKFWTHDLEELSPIAHLHK